MEELKNKIKELAQRVYKKLGGFGFIDEIQFETALAYEFRKSGIKYLEQIPVDIMYESQIIKRGIIDFIVFDEKEENAILVELKARESIKGEYLYQILKYYEAIKDENVSFPKILSSSVNSLLLLNWKVNRKTENALIDVAGQVHSETIKEDFEWLEELKDKIEMYEIKAEMYEIKVSKKKEKSDKVKILSEILEDLTENGKKHCKIDEFIEGAKVQGIDEKDAKKFIENAKREGRILEPRDGEIEMIE